MRGMYIVWIYEFVVEIGTEERSSLSIHILVAFYSFCTVKHFAEDSSHPIPHPYSSPRKLLLD